MRLVKNVAKMLGNGEIGGCFPAAKNGCDKTPPSFLHLSGCRNDMFLIFWAPVSKPVF